MTQAQRQTLRRVQPINLPNLEILPLVGSSPAWVHVAPTDLFVEEEYQRNLSENSIRLIRKIARQWNWAHTKPPICVRDGDKFMVIDGQHTAIAAASRGDIKKLPIVVLPNCALSERALAFVAHNTLRVQVTATQIYFSKLAAGDEIARLVDQACKRAGAKILRVPPGHGIFKTGETMAVRGLQGVVEKKGVAGAARILKILVGANRHVKNTEIAAVYLLLYSNKFPKIEDADLCSVIGLKPIMGWENAVIPLREKQKISLSMALATRWAKELEKRGASL